MRHTLVVPNDLINKLNAVMGDATIMTRWGQIGVNSPDEMMEKIIFNLNKKFRKLNLVGYRQEDKINIKGSLNNTGNASKYLGYLVNEEDNIDGLFFYNEPKTNNANDITTRNVWAALIGIYGAISEQMVDLHFNSRPVYIVNLNETSRLNQRSVKINIICALLMGFHYIDIFDNVVTDVIPVDHLVDFGTNYKHGNPCQMITTLKHFSDFVSGDQDNEFFLIDEIKKTVTVLSDKLTKSSNPSAELYRFCSRIVPAAYFAQKDKYQIDIQNLEQINNTNINVLKAYLRRFNEQ